MTEHAFHRAGFAALEKSSRVVAPWSELRRKAHARFEELGYPTTRQEDWRWTNVAPLERVPFALASHAGGRELVGLDRSLVGRVPGWRLTFVNGRFDRELSRLDGLPAGVRVAPLAASLLEPDATLETHLARHAPWRDHPFTALNTAFLEDGALLHVPRGTRLDEPVHVLFVTSSGEDPLISHPRVLVVAEEGSEATVVETHAGSGRTLSNAVTELALGEGAVLTHVKIQRDSVEGTHVGSLHATQSRGSSLRSSTLGFGSALSRSELSVLLDGEGAECALDGLSVGHGQQHQDVRTFVDHARPHCTSRQLFKAVLAGKSRGVFNGRVLVRKDAQKTSAHQQNRNLLLSEDALADTKPQLEIHADDVKCTHGATIGQLDDESLFYLRSRGLSARQATGLLVHAFAAEMVGRIAHPSIRAEAEELVMGFLPEAELEARS